MPATLTLLQLNVERSKNLSRIIPFIQSNRSDVICLQELLEKDIPLFEKELGMKHVFVPMCIQEGEGIQGLGMFFTSELVQEQAQQYGGNFDRELPVYIRGDRQKGYESSRFVVLLCDIEKDGEIFRIGTTHGPVSPKGEITTDFQRESVKNLLALLEKEKDFVLTGDFNAPRGGEIFAQLASKYKDNIPAEITTSIDGSFHRAGQLQHMVDGIFSTPAYLVSNVVGHTGLSDHWGFTAKINKVEI